MHAGEFGAVATARDNENGDGKVEQKLIAVTTEGLAEPGTSCSIWSGEGDLRRWWIGGSSMQRFRGERALGARSD